MPEVSFASEGPVYAIPIFNRVLIYAPLHGFLALVDKTAQLHIQKSLTEGIDTSNKILEILKTLRSQPIHTPHLRTGGLGIPLFLGLITTRGCNMSCSYCDFIAPKDASPCMEPGLAKKAIDAYFALLVQHGVASGAIHFFGGEPFYAAQVVHFSVEYAKMRASELGLSVRFEVITNGLFNQQTCRWIANTFDTVLLSFDGPADIQDRYRPARNLRSAFELVSRNAKLLAKSGTELILRACVTHETSARLPEIAHWFAEEFAPDGVCFESLIPSPAAEMAGLLPPDPWEFARYFCQASDVLESYGIQSTLSTAEPGKCQVSFCPVGKDAMIVDSTGTISACYLLPQDWEKAGLHLSYGAIDLETDQIDQALKIDGRALDEIRSLNVTQYPLCSECFCRYHCSGGCHVKHRASLFGHTYDDLCIQTRAVSLIQLLKMLDANDLIQEWMDNSYAHKASILQATDRLW